MTSTTRPVRRTSLDTTGITTTTLLEPIHFFLSHPPSPTPPPLQALQMLFSTTNFR